MGTTVAPLARRSIELASLLLSRDFQRTWSLSRITKATGRRLSRREGGVCRDFARLPWSLQASSLRDHGLRSGQCPCPPRAMGRVSGLVPSRFLTLLAHLVVVITLFWSRDSNVQACLPLKFTPEEYERQDIQLVAALSVTLGLFAVELAGFLSGVSMFNSTQSLISIGAHCSASVALSFFIFERWECTTYWYIFVFCSAFPAATEMALFVAVFGLKKKPF
ncbi:transmembrane protein 107 isoform X1 [Tupaia chinensis]|uniref:transmembrane protein 107 isoform X1 n=1 Tax=Tupaia chinensis TaxID=246437 RepID=UPI0003C8ECEE|nr:transmembrane protein 107 isoform X1 [Tupaia chinensis]